MSSEHTHPWGDPDIDIPDPLGANQLPLTPWTSLRFHPIGLLHLRRHLGVYPHIRGFFQQHQSAFEASDIAWFGAGQHQDGRHHISRDRFHSEYMDIHNLCGNDRIKRQHQKKMMQNVLDLIYDLATLLDRACGSTTLVLHAKPTVVPGSLMRPEFMKADAYFPPSFITHHPDARPALLRIVQDFIVNVGVPTVEDWRRRARNSLNWHFSTDHPIPLANQSMLDFPNPEHGTSHYVFLGQPHTSGTTAPSSAPTPAFPVPPVPLIASGSQSSEYGFEDYDSSFIDSLTLHEYQEELVVLTSEAEALRSEVKMLRSQCSDLTNRNNMLEKMLQMEPVPTHPTASPSSRSFAKSPRKPVPSTPSTPSVPRIQGSPFVTVRTDRQCSPFTSSSHVEVSAEPTTPSASQRRAARFAPVTSASPLFATRASATLASATRASAISENTGNRSVDTTMLDHILRDHGISHLRPQILLISKYVSAKTENFSLELASAGVPEGAILSVMKASLFDTFDDE